MNYSLQVQTLLKHHQYSKARSLRAHLNDFRSTENEMQKSIFSLTEMSLTFYEYNNHQLEDRFLRWENKFGESYIYTKTELCDVLSIINF